MEQSRTWLERGDVELLIMGVRALAVDTEPVERTGVGRSEIAVRAAAGMGIDQLKAELGGERLRMLVQRGAGIALLIGWTVELAGDGHRHALGLRGEPEN